MSYAVIVSNATKVLGGRTVLDNVSFTAEDATICGFSGINGSGKTMLFNAISGLMHLTSGTVEVFGDRIGIGRDFPTDLGLVLNSNGLLDDRTGLKNLQMLASIRRVASKTDIHDALMRVDLDPADKRPVSAYSLGMRQRLLIAQAIMERPKLIIMDEPLNSLDTSGVQMVLDLILDLREKNGTTFLVSGHNEPSLERLYDRIFLMEEGRLQEAGR